MHERPRKNKANPPIADCGLQDRPAASGLLRAIAPNKPNSRVTAARGRGTHGRDAHATERLTASPRLRGDDIATHRASAPNKPNFGGGDLEDKCCADNELRRIGRAGGLEKTKPIWEELQVCRGRPLCLPCFRATTGGCPYRGHAGCNLRLQTSSGFRYIRPIARQSGCEGRQSHIQRIDH